MWLTGWSGTGKSLTLNLLQDFLGNSNVLQWHPSFLSLEKNLEEFARNQVSLLSPCFKNILIVDSWDDGSSRIIDAIREMIKGINTARDSFHLKKDYKLLVILSGSAGSKNINTEFLKLKLSGGGRAEVSLSSLTASLRTSQVWFLVSLFQYFFSTFF